jgi:omega-6 fatty acid desaturase (delta-12 desaturase)
MESLTTQELRNSLLKILVPYQRPDTLKSLWQLANTILPYIALWALMFLSLRVSYWLTLILSIPTAGFMVRSFIIFHDCGHGSFFKTKRANEIAGIITGILTLTPWTRWWHDHAIHHATAGDLDRRGVGDVYVMTLKEYRESSWWKKIGYRLMRNPINMFFIGGPIIFAIINRCYLPGTGRRERRSVMWTNLALAAIVTILCVTQGWKAYLLVQLPVLFLGSATGIWLFYLQHQFEGVYWERHDRWNFYGAGLNGSSYFKLPGLLQWFTGNIGFHHIHHLSSRIPNYLLEKCLRENPALQNPPTLTLLSSIRSLKLRLYDEDTRQLIGWKN